MFCDVSTLSGPGWNAYVELRHLLIGRDIPAAAIRFMHKPPPTGVKATGRGFGDLEADENVASRDIRCCDIQVWQVLGQPRGSSAT